MELVNQLPYHFPEPVAIRPRKARIVRTFSQEDVVFQVLLKGPREVDRQLVVCFHKPDPLGTFWVLKGHVLPHTALLSSWGHYPTLDALRGKGFWSKAEVISYWISPKWEHDLQEFASRHAKAPSP